MRRVAAFGVGTYVRNVVRSLARLDTTNEFVLLGSPARLHELQEFPDQNNGRCIEKLPPNFILHPFTPLTSSPQYYLEFHRQLRRYCCDVLHVPYLFGRPLWTPCP